MNSRPLTVAEAEAFRNLRLYALQESPAAFSSAYEDELSRPLTHTIERLKNQQQPNNCIFGTFEDDLLIGMAGFFQHEAIKLRHKSIIWGVYVHPDRRRQGIARHLMTTIIEQAKGLPAVKQIHIAVINENTAAKSLYVSLGFVEWGIEPRALLVNGIFYNEAYLTLKLD